MLDPKRAGNRLATEGLLRVEWKKRHLIVVTMMGLMKGRLPSNEPWN